MGPSRASLLYGTLTRGDQATERAGFAAHAGLVAASRAGRPPRLFHKADLGPGPELPASIGNVIADPQQRVVGVVHNASEGADILAEMSRARAALDSPLAARVFDGNCEAGH
jgi:hypothetical protein